MREAIFPRAHRCPSRRRSGDELELRLRRGPQRGAAGSPTPSRLVRIEAGSVRAATIRRRRMQRKAARGKAQGRCTHPGSRILQGTSQTLAGACPGGDEPSHRSRGESHQHGLLGGEPIGLSCRRAGRVGCTGGGCGAHASPRSAAPPDPTTAGPLRKPELHPQRRRLRRA